MILIVLISIVFIELCFARNYTGFGVVNFKHSCEKSVDDKIQVAVGAYYSFFYDVGAQLFDEIVGNDTDCCIAIWGQAVSKLHPIWT
jgi:hypothetical protein